MYYIVSTLCSLIRFFLLPNPFDPLFSDLHIEYFGLLIHIPPECSIFLKVMIEPFIWKIAYTNVGLYYNKQMDSPIYGSILYLIFYSMITFLLYFMSLFGFANWSIIVSAVTYVGIQVLANGVRSRLTVGW